MKKSLLLGCLVLCLNFAWAQDGIKFKIKYKPNHTYTINGTSSISLKTDLSSNADIAAALQKQGITQPIVGDIKINTSGSMVTGKQNADNSFPLTMNVSSPNSSGTINGNPIPIPNKTSTTQIFGHVDATSKISIDSLSGKKLNDSTSVIFKNIMDKMFNVINFPEKSLSLGESFTQDVPINIPLAGKGMSINVKITYKLTSINGGKAFFDMVQNMDMHLNMQSTDLILTGNGTGKMVYDIKNNFPASLSSSLNIFITIKSAKLNAVATGVIGNETNYTIN